MYLTPSTLSLTLLSSIENKSAEGIPMTSLCLLRSRDKQLEVEMNKKVIILGDFYVIVSFKC